MYGKMRSASLITWSRTPYQPSIDLWTAALAERTAISTVSCTVDTSLYVEPNSWDALAASSMRGWLEAFDSSDNAMAWLLVQSSKGPSSWGTVVSRVSQSTLVRNRKRSRRDVWWFMTEMGVSSIDYSFVSARQRTSSPLRDLAVVIRACADLYRLW